MNLPTTRPYGLLLRGGSALLLSSLLTGGCASWEGARQRNVETMFAAACGPQSETPEYRTCVDEQLDAYAPK